MPAATRWLRRGLDVLLVGLVALAVAGALVTSTARGVGAVLLGAALLALYVVGRRRVPVPVDVRAPRGAWWPAGAWVTGLVALWVGLSLVTTTAVWVAFPLMFVAMHVLGPRRGPVAVAVVVVLVVGVMAAWTARVALPFVLGPAIGGAVAVVVVLALEAVVRESQERQRTLDELVRTRDELAASERERAVAAERERLAREIHDTLAQGFSSAELLLRAARTALDAGDAETARGYVEQTREVARHNLAEARRVVRALAPADLASSNLVGALRRVADRASGRAAEGGPRVVVRVSGEPVPLPTEVEAALLRVAQSALANVERHAGATRAAVTGFLAGTGPGDDAVALDVVDDGRGFDPDAVPAPAADRPGGFGLGAMRARVADLGGTLSEAAVARDLEHHRYDSTTAFDYLFPQLAERFPRFHLPVGNGATAATVAALKTLGAAMVARPVTPPGQPPRSPSTPTCQPCTRTGASSSTTTSRSTPTAPTRRRAGTGTRRSATSTRCPSRSSRRGSWSVRSTTGATRRSTSTPCTAAGRGSRASAGYRTTRSEASYVPGSAKLRLGRISTRAARHPGRSVVLARGARQQYASATCRATTAARR